MASMCIWVWQLGSLGQFRLWNYNILCKRRIILVVGRWALAIKEVKVVDALEGYAIVIIEVEIIKSSILV